MARFVKAYNAGDADGVAATYSESAIVVDEDDRRVEGRQAIRDQYASAFAQEPGGSIQIEVEALHFLGDQTAMEQGRTTISPAGGHGAAEVTRFTAIYVKQNGHWLQSAVRDEPSSEMTPHGHLKELEWLVGDWINESQDAVVATTCKWAHEGQFLDREFTVKTAGRPVLSGTQRIGWDPQRKQFKTWIFDSEGGFAEGTWAQNGDQWVVKIEGTRQDGLSVSATNIITRLGKDRLGWQSKDRTLGGDAVPGDDAFVIVRKPPQAGQ